MDYGQAAERLMGMDDQVWLRHANPLSAWTRLLSAPLWFLALWSYVWIGWGALAPLAMVAAWTWANPRIFPPPRDANAWATKGVLGERVWLNRKAVPIPTGFVRATHITTGLSAIFMAVAIYGFVAKDFWAAMTGWHAAVMAKVWFVDRCVWLWEKMKDADPSYGAWVAAIEAGS